MAEFHPEDYTWIDNLNKSVFRCRKIADDLYEVKNIHRNIEVYLMRGEHLSTVFSPGYQVGPHNEKAVENFLVIQAGLSKKQAQCIIEMYKDSRLSEGEMKLIEGLILSDHPSGFVRANEEKFSRLGYNLRNI